MTNEEKILRAIGEIDEELIKEASTPYAYKRTFTPLTRGLTVAASVVLVSAAVLSASQLIFSLSQKGSDKGGMSNSNDMLYPEDGDGSDLNGAPSNGSSGSDDDGEKSEIIKSNYGVICGIEREEFSVSFTLKLYRDSDLDFKVTLIGVNKENGKLASCTDAPNTHLFDEVFPINITVDGKRADKLPTSEGTYEISVDYSEISETEYEWNDYITIWGFGDIQRD